MDEFSPVNNTICVVFSEESIFSGTRTYFIHPGSVFRKNVFFNYFVLEIDLFIIVLSNWFTGLYMLYEVSAPQSIGTIKFSLVINGVSNNDLVGMINDELEIGQYDTVQMCHKQ